jgi:hypothetical protein
VYVYQLGGIQVSFRGCMASSGLSYKILTKIELFKPPAKGGGSVTGLT